MYELILKKGSPTQPYAVLSLCAKDAHKWTLFCSSDEEFSPRHETSFYSKVAFHSWFASISRMFCCFAYFLLHANTLCGKISRGHQDSLLFSVLTWGFWWSPWMCTRARTVPGFWLSLNNYSLIRSRELDEMNRSLFYTAMTFSVLVTWLSPTVSRRKGTSCMDVPRTHGHSASHLYAACESIKQSKVQICTNSCRHGGSETKLH